MLSLWLVSVPFITAKLVLSSAEGQYDGKQENHAAGVAYVATPGQQG